MLTKNKENNIVLTIAILGSLVFLNLLSANHFFRVDLTRDGKFTLSDASKDTVRNLDDVVTVSAYFTKGLPVPYAGHGRYLRDLLEEYRAASKGNFSFEMLDPAEEETTADKAKKKESGRDIFGRLVREPTSVERQLAELGVRPVEIRVIEDDQQQTKRAYMGVVLRYQDELEVIPVLQDLPNLEKEMTSLMRKLTRERQPVLAIVHNSDFSQISNLRKMLEANYEIKDIEPDEGFVIGEDVDSLLFVGNARVKSGNVLREINKFIQGGKNATLLLDKIEVDPQTFKPRAIDKDDESKGANLYGMLEKFGVKMAEGLVADVECVSLSMREQRGQMVLNVPVKYPFIPEVIRLNQESNVTRGLSGIIFPFVTSLEISEIDGIKATQLAFSSKNSWLESLPPNLDPRRDWRQSDINVSGPYPVMAKLEGEFPDLYKEDTGEISEAGDQVVVESRVLLAGTSGLVWDEFLGGPNQALALNMVDWMMADSSLLAMRSRAFADAPIDPDISDVARASIKYGNIVGMPILLVLYGLLRWRRRERRRMRIKL